MYGIEEGVIVDWGSEPALGSTSSSAVLKDTPIVLLCAGAQQD